MQLLGFLARIISRFMYVRDASIHVISMGRKFDSLQRSPPQDNCGHSL